MVLDVGRERVSGFIVEKIDYRHIPRRKKEKVSYCWILGKEPSIQPLKPGQLPIIRQKIFFVLFTFSLTQCIINSVTDESTILIQM